MAKVLEQNRLDFKDAVVPYESKIKEVLGKENAVLNEIAGGAEDSAYKKIMLCDDMLYVSTLYMAQNSLSLKMLDVKNNDALNDARKALYKAVIYLEELVTNFIDIAYADLVGNYETIKNVTVGRRYHLVRKLGLAIGLLEAAFGDNSKWKWSFVELKGRFVVVAKNFIDMRRAAKSYFNPNDGDYETSVLYIRMLGRLLDTSAAEYRDKYELSTRRLDDMLSGIKFLLARNKLYLAINDAKTAEEAKRKAVVWKNKMDADKKAGNSR